MKISDTISVNPAKNTLGHQEVANSPLFRSQVLGATSGHENINITKILFPTALASSSEFRKYEVPLRTLFATLLIVVGISSLQASQSVGMAIVSLCFGAFLALGLFTRPVMLGAAIYYCISGALALRAGEVNMTLFTLMFGCLVFAVVGSGKYSSDTLIRGWLIKHKKAAAKKREEEMMGYKAFHHAKF